MLRTICRVAALATGCTVLAFGAVTAVASADTMSALPTEAPIINKLYVPITMTVSCSPGYFGSPNGNLSVTIRQVVHGNTIAHGTSSMSVMCDDTPQDYTVSVFPDADGYQTTASAPFKKGDAVISATISKYYSPPVTAGPQSIRLK